MAKMGVEGGHLRIQIRKKNGFHIKKALSVHSSNKDS